MPQLKYWNGSAFVAPKAVKTWDGSQWVDRSGKAKYWNGSQWVPFQTTKKFYVISDGILQNGYSVEKNGTRFAADYDQYEKAYKMYSYDGGHCTIRTQQNFEVTNYSRMFAECRMTIGSTGSGQIFVANPYPSGVGSNQWSVLWTTNDAASYAIKSVSLADRNGSASIYCSESSDYEYDGTFFIKNLWFE